VLDWQDAIEGGRYSKASEVRSAALKGLIGGYGTQNIGQRWDINPALKSAGARIQDPAMRLNGAGLDMNTSARLEAFASATLDEVIHKSMYKGDKVLKSFCPELRGPMQFMTQFSAQNMSQSLLKGGKGRSNKTIALTSPLSSGFVPYDLVPFVRTIYPVYTLLRNKLPRVPGQGTYHRAKIMASITGSLPGQLGTLQDDSTSEFFGGSFSSWPNALPASGTQTAYDLMIPYKFFALTEGVSWLAQFAGQGYDDVFGLAAMILLQEFMLLEEHDILASSSQALATPTTATIATRNAGTGETPITFAGGTNIWVTVTALDFWGETTYNATAAESTTATTGTSVIDVTLPLVNGAMGYKIYIGNNSSTQPARTSLFQFVGLNTLNGIVGATKFTLQGALPTTGANPPSADTGTGSTNRMESIIAVVSGRSYNSGSGPYPGPGSSPAVNPGYYKEGIGLPLNVSVVQTALQQMFNGTNGYFANPSEIMTSPNDATTLNNSILSESVAAYQLRIQQTEMAGVTAGAAVSNVVNPVTRSMPEIVVHPYMTQGMALFLSYTLPQTQNNLGNVMENVMVQDYAQIGWPVIDPTFRQSILRFGSFFCAAPQYLGLISGLQQSSGTSTPYF
jgi:hypothetical protein